MLAVALAAGPVSNPDLGLCRVACRGAGAGDQAFPQVGLLLSAAPGDGRGGIAAVVADEIRPPSPRGLESLDAHSRGGAGVHGVVPAASERSVNSQPLTRPPSPQRPAHGHPTAPLNQPDAAPQATTDPKPLTSRPQTAAGAPNSPNPPPNHQFAPQSAPAPALALVAQRKSIGLLNRVRRFDSCRGR